MVLLLSSASQRRQEPSARTECLSARSDSSTAGGRADGVGEKGGVSGQRRHGGFAGAVEVASCWEMVRAGDVDDVGETRDRETGPRAAGGAPSARRDRTSRAP